MVIPDEPRLLGFVGMTMIPGRIVEHGHPDEAGLTMPPTLEPAPHGFDETRGGGLRL